GDEAQRIKPVLVGCGPLKPDPAADRLPAPTMGFHPHDPAVDRVEVEGPGQRFLHLADGGGRRDEAHRLRFLTDEVGELVEVIRPGVEISLPPRFGQTVENCGGFREPLLDHARRPTAHRTPPAVSTAHSNSAMASASLSSAGLKPRARTAASTASLPALPLAVT